MSSINGYNRLHRAIESIISLADPAALGGTSGEYENQVNEIVRLLIEGKTEIRGENLQEMFTRAFPDCNVGTLEDFSRIAKEINEKVL